MSRVSPDSSTDICFPSLAHLAAAPSIAAEISSSSSSAVLRPLTLHWAGEAKKMRISFGSSSSSSSSHWLPLPYMTSKIFTLSEVANLGLLFNPPSFLRTSYVDAPKRQKSPTRAKFAGVPLTFGIFNQRRLHSRSRKTINRKESTRESVSQDRTDSGGNECLISFEGDVPLPRLSSTSVRKQEVLADRLVETGK